MLQMALVGMKNDGTCTICGKTLKNGQIVVKCNNLVICSQKCGETTTKQIATWTKMMETIGNDGETMKK